LSLWTTITRVTRASSASSGADIHRRMVIAASASFVRTLRGEIGTQVRPLHPKLIRSVHVSKLVYKNVYAMVYMTLVVVGLPKPRKRRENDARKKRQRSSVQYAHIP
jgi:hypothetical protein